MDCLRNHELGQEFVDQRWQEIDVGHGQHPQAPAQDTQLPPGTPKVTVTAGRVARSTAPCAVEPLGQSTASTGTGQEMIVLHWLVVFPGLLKSYIRLR
jgi:hypothetical protein